MADWDAAQYLKFERERTRPARDLLSAVILNDPRIVIDLGCGPGNSTQLLVDRFPRATVIGVDNSPDMLAKARTSVPESRFENADIARWAPSDAPDLIFANAVLQWLPDHAAIMPRLLDCLSPGGILAVQMPDNLDEPSHVLMRKVAAQAAFTNKLSEVAKARTTLATMDDYYGWLKPTAADVDIWRTTYAHPLEGASAIVEWLKATGLRPFVDPLTSTDRVEFLARYSAELETAYPQQADGKSLLHFPRLFIVAKRH